MRGLRLTTEEFITLSCNKYGKNSINYKKCNYINMKTKVVLICLKHNYKFEVYPSNHLSKNISISCQKCQNDKHGKSTSILTTKEFIKRSKLIFKDKYSYSKTRYVNDSTHLTITCNTCSTNFTQKPSNHYLDKGGCPVCRKSRNITTEHFITRSKFLYKDKYDYSETRYVNAKTKVKIRCVKHNELFECLPDNHYRYIAQCSQCFASNVRISALETEWLNSINLPNDTLHRQVAIRLPDKRNPIRVDGYDPLKNTCYLFHGTFYHGHPDYYNRNDVSPISGKTYGYLYQKTIEQENMLKSQGYNIEVMWEHVFNPLFNIKRIKPIKKFIVLFNTKKDIL